MTTNPFADSRRAKASDGLPAAPSRAGDVLLPERAALELLGGLSFMWIRRRIKKDPTFPQLVRLGRRRHYWRNDLLRWIGSPAASRPSSDQRERA